MEESGLFKSEGYELEKHIAGDSWGELYRAAYVPHRRPVLFRRFAWGLSGSEPWQLAAAEIQAWARVDHPGILQPLDWGNPPAGPFVATTMPSGLPLAAALEQRDAAYVTEPASTFAALVEAVEAARLFGVLHLGLGLHNIWVTPEGNVQVGEFGFWYVYSEHRQLPAPERLFLAPEQRALGRVSAATDVYALGLIAIALHEGLEGLQVYGGGDRSACSGLDPSLGALAAQCLLEDPLTRPHSAGQLVEGHPGAQGRTATAYRDCPICRLKEEIAHDIKLGRRTASGRLLDLDADTFRAAVPAIEPMDENVMEDSPGPSVPAPGIASLFPWIAIASLVFLTLAVWWLAFR
jgi:serine/threonine protein kinase